MTLENAINIICTLVIAVCAILAIARRSEKRDVTIQPGTATQADIEDIIHENRKEHDGFRDDIAKLELRMRDEFNVKFSEISKTSDDSRRRLHKRVDHILQGLSLIQGRLQIKAQPHPEEDDND